MFTCPLKGGARWCMHGLSPVQAQEVQGFVVSEYPKVGRSWNVTGAQCTNCSRERQSVRVACTRCCSNRKATASLRGGLVQLPAFRGMPTISSVAFGDWEGISCAFLCSCCKLTQGLLCVGMVFNKPLWG